jgi:galactoside O-acetyltransferase
MSDNIFFNRKDLKKCGENAIIGKTVRIRRPEMVSIGDNVIIDDFTSISGEVEIGDYCHIAPSVTLAASQSKITLKEFVGLSAGVKIYAASSDYFGCSLDMPTIPKEFSYGAIFSPVVLERFCLLAANTIVLPGCHIPEGISCSSGMTLRKGDFRPWRLLLENGKSIARPGKAKMLRQVEEFYTL